MRILVIGGTQFFGMLLVHKLLAAQHEVTIFSRGNNQPTFMADVERIIGDRNDYATFKSLLRDRRYDVVIDNVAYQSQDVKSALDTFAGKVGQYILCSTGSIYRFEDSEHRRQLHPIKEEEADLSHMGDHPYNEGKRAAELALWQSAQEAGAIPFTIIRPAVVHGPGDPTGRSWFWVRRILDGEPILLPLTQPSTIFRHVYSADVADAIFGAIGNEHCFQSAYNVAGDDIVSLEDFLAGIAFVVGKPLQLAPAPLNWIAEQRQLSEYEPVFAGSRFVLDNGKAKHDLSFRPTSIYNWLRTTVESLVESPPSDQLAKYWTRQEEIRCARKLGAFEKELFRSE